MYKYNVLDDLKMIGSRNEKANHLLDLCGGGGLTANRLALSRRESRLVLGTFVD